MDLEQLLTDDDHIGGMLSLEHFSDDFFGVDPLMEESSVRAESLRASNVKSSSGAAYEKSSLSLSDQSSNPSQETVKDYSGSKSPRGNPTQESVKVYSGSKSPRGNPTQESEKSSLEHPGAPKEEHSLNDYKVSDESDDEEKSKISKTPEPTKPTLDLRKKLNQKKLESECRPEFFEPYRPIPRPAFIRNENLQYPESYRDFDNENVQENVRLNNELVVARNILKEKNEQIATLLSERLKSPLPQKSYYAPPKGWRPLKRNVELTFDEVAEALMDRFSYDFNHYPLSDKVARDALRLCREGEFDEAARLIKKFQPNWTGYLVSVDINAWRRKQRLRQKPNNIRPELSSTSTDTEVPAKNLRLSESSDESDDSLSKMLLDRKKEMPPSMRSFNSSDVTPIPSPSSWNSSDQEEATSTKQSAETIEVYNSSEFKKSTSSKSKSGQESVDGILTKHSEKSTTSVGGTTTSGKKSSKSGKKSVRASDMKSSSAAASEPNLSDSDSESESKDVKIRVGYKPTVEKKRRAKLPSGLTVCPTCNVNLDRFSALSGRNKHMSLCRKNEKLGIKPKRKRRTQKEILEAKEKSSSSARASDMKSSSAAASKKSSSSKSGNKSVRASDMKSSGAAASEKSSSKVHRKSDQVKTNLIQECDDIRQRSQVEKMEKAVEFAMIADCKNNYPLYTYLQQPKYPKPVTIQFAKDSGNKSPRGNPCCCGCWRGNATQESEKDYSGNKSPRGNPTQQSEKDNSGNKSPRGNPTQESEKSEIGEQMELQLRDDSGDSDASFHSCSSEDIDSPGSKTGNEETMVSTEPSMETTINSSSTSSEKSCVIC